MIVIVRMLVMRIRRMNVATCIRRCVADAGLGLRLEPERSEENGR